jgi:acetyltransferase-like isoleucine patch superfamily enzyme
MSPQSLLTVWLRHFWSLLRTPRMKVALYRRYPTCEFYDGAFVDERSSLENYNVVFENSTVCNSRIGAHSYVQKNSSVSNCTIGRFCSIAPNVHIGQGQHPIDRVSTHPAFYSASQPLARTYAAEDSFQPFKPITIGNDVWIGHSVLVMDGVTIGNGAVIAANAVVAADVPPYAIVGGVPARLIRYRFDESIARRLNQAEWWNKPEAWLADNHRLFASPEELLRLLESLDPRDSQSP